MSATAYDPATVWNATNRYTASGVTPVKINNSHPYILLFWTTTLNDTTPTIPVGRANAVPCSGTDRIELKDGERLWLAAGDGTGAASIEV
jgi:hypothetical protein